MASVCQPSTLRMLICPEASSAQNNIAAVSAEGSTVCVFIRRLNSSCRRSIAFVVLRERLQRSIEAKAATHVRAGSMVLIFIVKPAFFCPRDACAPMSLLGWQQQSMPLEIFVLRLAFAERFESIETPPILAGD